MKCSVCNYRYKETQENELISDGEEKFIQVIPTFHFKQDDGSLEECYLFACPKCGTVKLKPWSF